MELPLVFSLVFLLCLLRGGASSDSRSNFTSMFTLGDSYIDTGNFGIMAAAAVPVLPVWQDNLPYGMTFFHRPTGRLSDGRVIIDFIAEKFGLPLLPASPKNRVGRQASPVWADKLPYGMTFFHRPTGRQSDGRVTVDFIAEKFGLPLLPASLKNTSDVSSGVNFAVGGATAIDVDFFERNNLVQFKLLNNSLSVQLGWFEELRPRICKSTAGCFSKALFFVGEFGVNDYNFLWMAGKTEAQVKSYVPQVVERISMAVERLIREGAAYVVVPGNPPNGCSPAILTVRAAISNKTDYDRMGCLVAVNDVARYHNSLLRAAVRALRGSRQGRHAKIIFADFYSPVIDLLGGATVDAPLRACCGGGGTYNWNASAICGMPGLTACKDPSASVSWDGVHYTEATNRYIADKWLNGPYADPPILTALGY